MKTINELQDEVIEEFSDFDDWMDKYQLLIDLGNEQEPLDEKYKTEQNLIDGCQSRVWLQADMEDGNVVFQAESDALIVKGIIALLIKVVSGHTPDEILNSDLYFIEKIGLKEHLSPTRSNGLLAMVKQMRMYALAFKAKQAEIGVRDMIALRGQDEFQQLDDLHNNAGKIQDQLAAADEARRIREKPRKEEERRRRMEMSEEAYFRLKERKEREAYERRKITIR